MSVKMNDIDNTKLEEAMQVYIKDQDKENLVRLVYAIHEAVCSGNGGAETKTGRLSAVYCQKCGRRYVYAGIYFDE